MTKKQLDVGIKLPIETVTQRIGIIGQTGSWPNADKGAAPPVGYGRDAPNHPDVTVGGGLRRILIALAQNPAGLSKRQIGIRAQLSSKSGTFSTYLSRARTENWIEDLGDTIRITALGESTLGKYCQLPTGTALQAYWCDQLKGGASRMLQELCKAYPDPLSDQALGEAAGLNHKSGTFSTYLSKMRTLELVSGGRDALLASSDLI